MHLKWEFIQTSFNQDELSQNFRSQRTQRNEDLLQTQRAKTSY